MSMWEKLTVVQFHVGKESATGLITSIEVCVRCTSTYVGREKREESAGNEIRKKRGEK